MFMHIEAYARKQCSLLYFFFIIIIGEQEILEIKSKWLKSTMSHQLRNTYLSIWNVIFLLT